MQFSTAFVTDDAQTLRVLKCIDEHIARIDEKSSLAHHRDLISLLFSVLYGLVPYNGLVPTRRPLALEFPTSNSLTNSPMFYTMMWLQHYANRCWIQAAYHLGSAVFHEGLPWNHKTHSPFLDSHVSLYQSIALTYHSVRLLENYTSDFAKAVHKCDLECDMEGEWIPLIFDVEWNELLKISNAAVTQLLMVCHDASSNAPDKPQFTPEERISIAFESSHILHEVKARATRISAEECKIQFPYLQELADLAVAISHLWLTRLFTSQSLFVQAGFLWEKSKELNDATHKDKPLWEERHKCVSVCTSIKNQTIRFDPATDPLDKELLETYLPALRHKDLFDLSTPSWYDRYPPLSVLDKAAFRVSPKTDLWTCTFVYWPHHQGALPLEEPPAKTKTRTREKEKERHRVKVLS